MRARILLSFVTAFAAAAVATRGSDAQDTTQALQVPSPAALLARHVAALGGVEALNKHSTVRLTGTVNLDAGALTGTVEILRGKPNKFVQRMLLNSVGELVKGYDGTTAWTLEMAIPAILTDADAASVKSHAQWDHDYMAPTALYIGRVDTAEFEGQQAWRVTFAADLGLELHSYFSRETGLRIGMVTNALTGTITTIYTDYTEFGGVKIPARLITRADANEIVIAIAKVEFDKVDSKAFDLPAPVKAIAKD